MKKLIFIFFALLSTQLIANPFLVEVNQEWLNQSDVNLNSIEYIPYSETDAIQLHLKLVEQALRKRDVSHLSETQKANRTKCLDILNMYWKASVFPQNEDYNYRTPIFIDKYNTFCAVGHLMKESGYEKIAREISDENKIVYVRDITNQQATDWMQWAGLLMEECAWIQPGYAPSTKFESCGKGVNATVKSLYSTGNELFVLGDFTIVDSSINSLGVAKWKKIGLLYAWEDFSQGLPFRIINGQFVCPSSWNKMIQFNGHYWLGGEQSMYATAGLSHHLYVRSGNTWQIDSSLRGDVKDFAVYKNELYACGNFSNSTGRYFLAKLNALSNTWELLFHTVNNTNFPMYALKVFNDKLIVGGGNNIFQLNCYNIFSFDGTNVAPMYTGLSNTVRTIEVHEGELYAAGDMNGGLDIYNMKYFNGQVWLDTNTFNLNVTYTDYIASLKSIDGTLYWGGAFRLDPFIGTYAFNLMTNQHEYHWGVLDSSVSDIAHFDGKVYIAGDFITTNYSSPNHNRIAHINTAPSATSNIDNVTELVVYPNPTPNMLHINSEKKIVRYSVRDLLNKQVIQGKLFHNKIDLTMVSPGFYIVLLEDTDGKSYMKKVYKE